MPTLDTALPNAAARRAPGDGRAFAAVLVWRATSQERRTVAPSTAANPSPPRGADVAREHRDRELAALLARCAAGDAEAFDAFYDATLGYAHALARRIVADADLDDVLADAYVQAWQQRSRFDAARGSAVSWLLAIVRTRALDQRRSEQLRAHAPLADGDGDAVADDAAGPDALLDFAERGSRLHAALATLSAQERWLLALAYFRDWTHAEIARSTGLPLGTVKSAILRAQHKLRDLLAPLAR